MTARLTGIWRHPIKSHGREALDSVTLTPGQPLPWDRVWAVAHERSKANGSQWMPCAHFCRVAKTGALMAITASLDEVKGVVTLRHPDRPALVFDPDTETGAFLGWVAPLVAEAGLQPARIVRAQRQAFTDSDFPSVTIANMASHRAVEARLGREASPLRWRSNLWIDGFAPWEEFDWIGRDIRIGSAVLRVRERTERCKSTHANPDTGLRDVEMLETLRSFGHQDFSVRAEVVEGGEIRPDDQVSVI